MTIVMYGGPTSAPMDPILPADWERLLREGTTGLPEIRYVPPLASPLASAEAAAKLLEAIVALAERVAKLEAAQQPRKPKRVRR